MDKCETQSAWTLQQQYGFKYTYRDENEPEEMTLKPLCLDLCVKCNFVAF